MITALEWIERDDKDSAKYAIYTDSRSLTDSLKNNDWKDKHEWLRRIKLLLSTNTKDVTICWVPSHCKVFGNERADEWAERGSKLNQTNAPITYGIARAKIKNMKWAVEGERAKETFGERRNTKQEEKSWTASTRRLYARLRSGHAKELKDYRHRFLKTESAGT